MYLSDTCWVIEKRTGSKTGYATYDVCVEEPGVQWDTQWDRALKFYDRASAEMIAAEMCMDWDIRILEHQIVGTEREVQFAELSRQNEKLCDQRERKDAEITRLKEQLARTERERDQATKNMEVDENGEIWLPAQWGWIRIGNKDTHADLYAHLAGKVEG